MSRVNTSNSNSYTKNIDTIESRKKILLVHPRVLKVLETLPIDSPLMQVKDDYQPVSGELKKHAANALL